MRRVLDWDRRAVVYDPPISSKGALTGNIASAACIQDFRIP
jgi:hypothetical protein